MSEIFLTFYNILDSSIVELVQIAIIIIYIFLCLRFRISGQFTAKIGFVIFFAMIIFVIAQFTDMADLLAQYVFIFFTISFVQEFYHFLKYENK